MPTGFTQILNVQSAVTGLRAAPLTDMKLTMYGLKVDTKDFPSCSAATIGSPPSYDSACNPKAEIASGSIRALIGADSLQGAGTPCDPILHVWNSGGGNITFFFIASTAKVCGGVVTEDGSLRRHDQAGRTQPCPGHAAAPGRLDQGWEPPRASTAR